MAAEEFQEGDEPVDTSFDTPDEGQVLESESDSVSSEPPSPKNAIQGMRPLSNVGRGRAQAKAETAGLSIPIDDGEIIDEEETRVDPAEAAASVFGEPRKKAHFVVESDSDSEKFVVWVDTNIRCWIGPKHLEFKKDQKYRVSKNVKDVLLARGALKAV
jgi:hypothetical protein